MRENDRKAIRGFIESYFREKKKLPCLEDLAKEYPVFGPSAKTIIGDPELLADTVEIYLELFDSITSVSKGANMRKLFLEAYLGNKEVFREFSALNAVRENRKAEAFHEVGVKVQEILRDVENSLLSSMEASSKHNSKSSGVAGKFHDYVVSVFPLFDEIGVKSRYVTPVSHA